MQAGPYVHITGRIIDILEEETPLASKVAVIVLDIFHVMSKSDEVFGMPILSRRFGGTSLQVVAAPVCGFIFLRSTIFSHLIFQNVLFEYNAQHDCRHAKREASGERPLAQERVNSSLTESFMVHKPEERYLINTHAFHNAHLIRAALPRDLTALIPHAPDRIAYHAMIAMNLRQNQDAKRAKTAATAATKKAAEKTRSAGPKLAKRRRIDINELPANGSGCETHWEPGQSTAGPSTT